MDLLSHTELGIVRDDRPSHERGLELIVLVERRVILLRGFVDLVLFFVFELRSRFDARRVVQCVLLCAELFNQVLIL